ncbi:MAG: helix-turn-helix domain-containing protein [Proteobacteria bacterium]|nr:helix-turn-helix domain-containing protein [Pseudomonadota bacterium]
MKLSLSDVATLMNKSPRQIRYLITTGRLKAHKEGKSWRFDSHDLPLTSEQRETLVDNADAVTEAASKVADKARAAAGEPKRHYSVTDLRAYQLGEPLYRQLIDVCGPNDAATQRLRRALELLAMGCHAFHGREKRQHYAGAREAVASTITDLRLSIDADPTRRKQRCDLADTVEQTLLGPINALIRRAERKIHQPQGNRAQAAKNPPSQGSQESTHNARSLPR